MKECRRCFVIGRVQGVFFRAATRWRAGELGVTGYARNLVEGGVEVLACGEPAAVSALCAWLWRGPPEAAVKAVDCAVLEMAEIPAEFEVV